MSRMRTKLDIIDLFDGVPETISELVPYATGTFEMSFATRDSRSIDAFVPDMIPISKRCHDDESYHLPLVARVLDRWRAVPKDDEDGVRRELMSIWKQNQVLPRGECSSYHFVVFFILTYRDRIDSNRFVLHGA